MIKWGILGLGKAAISFANAIKEVENAKLISIASLSKNKMDSFQKKFNISKRYSFDIYQDLIEKKVINSEYPLMTWEDSIINMQILNKWKNILHKV